MNYGKGFEFGENTCDKLLVCVFSEADSDRNEYVRSFNIGNAEGKDTDNLDPMYLTTDASPLTEQGSTMGS